MMTTDDNKGTNPWLTLTAVCFGGFMAAMDTSIVNIILPALVKAFDTEFSWVQWVSMGYLFTVTVWILSFGKIGDIVGRKKVYLIGLFIFLAGSVLCGASRSVYWLIGFRILQGLGGAMIMALGFAIVTSVFPEKLRGRALGIIGAVVSCGVISGPVLGGLLTRMYSWHWVFWINLPIGILGIVMVAYHVPDNQVKNPHPFDYPSAFILFLALLPLLATFTLGQRVGFTSLPVLGMMAGFLLFGLLFVFRQFRVEHALVEIRLFSNTALKVCLANQVTVFFSTAGSMILLSFFFQDVLSFDIGRAGMMLAVIPIVMAVVSPLPGGSATGWGPGL